jgi:hypothetical protein
MRPRALWRLSGAARTQDPDKQFFHLCIVNLVIGTLYCAKGNYEFGVSRIMKSLEPYNKKARACLLSSTARHSARAARVC